jgi:hypothetical protein
LKKAKVAVVDIGEYEEYSDFTAGEHGRAADRAGGGGAFVETRVYERRADVVDRQRAQDEADGGDEGGRRRGAGADVLGTYRGEEIGALGDLGALPYRADGGERTGRRCGRCAGCADSG